ncbi:MAG: hypothetical protein H6766_06030 [Candidatus Peribacteria bacterium]|nr:MAG: hypothetical protein H6766_06030 [Candidatus Peribacteria bacterium]
MKGGRRISEKQLLQLCRAGGRIGGLV